MSTYTAPHRGPSKRSLSRRTMILLSSSALVPLTLLAITITPANAATKHVTLQDVQNAINAALAPIQNAIANLQQQQTNQANQLNNQQTSITSLQNTQATHTSQISDLQTQQQNQAQQITNLPNSANKTLKAFDANGHELGLAIDQQTIFLPAIQRFVHLFVNFATMEGEVANSPATTYYQSIDCTGTPYLGLSFGTTNLPSEVIPVTSQDFYIIPDSAVLATVSVNSKFGHSFSGAISCTPVSFSDKFYALQQVNLPFTVPFAVPLQFKYQ